MKSNNNQSQEKNSNHWVFRPKGFDVPEEIFVEMIPTAFQDRDEYIHYMFTSVSGNVSYWVHNDQKVTQEELDSWVWEKFYINGSHPTVEGEMLSTRFINFIAPFEDGEIAMWEVVDGGFAGFMTYEIGVKDGKVISQRYRGTAIF
jgi:hypothetical protein